MADFYAHRAGVVTGAGAGIGRALALDLAHRGVRLALWDQDAEAVHATADRCQRIGAVVQPAVVDVTDSTRLHELAEDTRNAFGRLDLAACVAGVIHTGSALTSDPADVDRVIDVNLRGTINTTRAVLPYLIASGDGHLVTVSSAFGLIGVPRYSVYCATKFAIRGYTDALRLEMRAAGHQVAVTCVVPGGVRTQIIRSGTFASGEDAAAVAASFERRIARTTPEHAAAQILRRLPRGSAQILIGPDARLAWLLTRAVGTGYQHLVRWLLGRSTTPRPQPGSPRQGGDHG